MTHLNSLQLRYVCMLVLLIPIYANAGDPVLGKEKSIACGGCHGVSGIAIAPNFPNLAGQKQDYLIKAMKAYRDGDRNDPTMAGMVAPLSDEDIENLAAFYARQPITQQ